MVDLKQNDVSKWINIDLLLHYTNNLTDDQITFQTISGNMKKQSLKREKESENKPYLGMVLCEIIDEFAKILEW